MFRFHAQAQATLPSVADDDQCFLCDLRRLIPTLVFCVALVVIPQFIDSSLQAADSLARPNIVVIMADDLGFSDLGCYGGEIETPHLDSLAKNGLRFTQFYNTARCWPSRAALLTGYYAQQVRRDTFPGLPYGERGNRPEWARLLPEVLRQSDYRSYHSGKWHLDGKPIENGFDRSYLLRDQGRFFSPKVHWRDDVKLPPVQPGTGFYGTTAIAEHAIKCLSEHAEKHADQPFFHYIAFTAPHFPLHALPADIEKYRGRYDSGWDVVRQQRWQRIQKAKLVSSRLSDVEPDIGPPYHFPDALEILGTGEVNRPVSWEQLTSLQKSFQAKKMEIHAAMVDRMDQEIGRILKQLKEMNSFDNTLLLFLSDNGASAEIMVRADGHDSTAPAGSAASYLCLGPGWATTSNTPFRRHKTWTHEGGISTPLIAHWPQGIQDKGKLRRQPGHIIDITATILELTGTARFKTWNDAAVPAPPGQSLLSIMTENEKAKPRTLWWSHEANRAIRQGNWKAVVSGENAAWELYHLAEDRTEQQNLASSEPERLQELILQWTKLRDEFYQLATAQTPTDEK